MKSVAAIIIQHDLEQLAAEIRAAYSAVRYAETLDEKASARAQKARADAETQTRRADSAREDARAKRLELGQLLVKLRPHWPTRGPKARGWGDFLAAEGISSQRASELMRLAGWVEAHPSLPGIDGDAGETSTPSYMDAGIDRRPRLGRADEQPDPPAGDELDDARIEIVSAGAALDLRLGDYREVLADIGMVDAVIADAPFGKRTHASRPTRDDGASAEGLAPKYPPWTPDDVHAFVGVWSPRTTGWMFAMTSHDLIPAWEDAYRAHDRFFFAPVICVIEGMSHRMQGDGPSSTVVYAMVARPRHFARWRTLPGHYIVSRADGAQGGRGKPPELMERIIGDYTNPGDLVCDPLAGFGETLLAAQKLGRRAIGSEIDAAARDEAIRRWRERQAA